MKIGEKITVDLGHGRVVTTSGICHYTGTITGPFGSANKETYEIECHGIECRGTWDNDARNAVHVADCPAALKEILEPTYRSQEQARNDRALSRMSPADRRYFGSLEA